MRCDVVAEHGAGGAAVVGAGYGAKPFGAGGVPELELDAFSAGAGADFYDFGGEFDADRV